jgi:hypothetical protein
LALPRRKHLAYHCIRRTARVVVSIRAVKWAFSVKTEPVNKLILVAIGESHNDKTGDCYPSQKYIEVIVGLSARSIRPRLKALEKDGFITRKPRYDTNGKRTSDGYVLHFGVTEARLPEEGASASLKAEPWKSANISRATWFSTSEGV